MAKLSLGFGSKVTALLLGSVLLTGCYKIEMRETLNLDGTSELALKMDMSGMAAAMSGISMQMAGAMDSTMMEIQGSSVETEVTSTLSYESCSDPELIEKYGAETLEGPETIETLVQAEKITQCAPSETEGMVNISIENRDKATGETMFGQTIERRADSCDAPALLAFYQIDSFEEPIVEPFTIKKTVDVSCSDIREEIQVTSITRYEGQDVPGPVLETFAKTPPNVIPEDTLAELEALTLSPEEIEAQLAAEEASNIDVCDDTETSPEGLPFFFTKCENKAPGVGVFYYTKYDTTGFKINPNGTVTYNLEPSTETFNETVTDELEKNNDTSMSPDIDPAMFGFAVDYVLVSPWPIIEHSAGVLEDEYTLRLDLLQSDELETLSVTLDTDGSTLDLLNPRTQLQIDQLIKSLEEQLTASDSSTERQIEYIYHLSGKIQQLARIRPDQQVPLGYLQTKLITLAADLEKGPMEDLEADFMAALAELEAEAFADEEDVFMEAEASIENETSTPDEALLFPREEPSLPVEDPLAEEEASDLEEALAAADETIVEEEETPAPIVEEDPFRFDEDDEEEILDEDEEEFFEEELSEDQDQAIVLE